MRFSQYAVRSAVLCYEGAATLSRIVKAQFLPYRLKQKLHAILVNSKPVVFGPWLSEVGPEILYWIPFLNWMSAEYNVPKERVIAISRGGVAQWYANVAARYVEIFDYFTPDEFRMKNEQRVVRHGYTQIPSTEFDREIIEIAKRILKKQEVAVVHPSLMYDLFREMKRIDRSLDAMERYARYSELPRDEAWQAVGGGLPDQYLAMKFYYSRFFPPTEDNRRLVSGLLKKLSDVTNVVLLHTGFQVDEHSEYDSSMSHRVYSIKHLVTPNNNLRVQTSVVRHARGFVGTYGGFSYIALFSRVPSVTFYSHDDFRLKHLELARRIQRRLGGSTYLVVDVNDVAMARTVLC